MKPVIILFVFAALCMASCQHSQNETLKVAATSVPHAEILEQIKPDLQKEGINLQVVVVEDYNTPNRALADKEIDANFFQHEPFLEAQKKEFDYKLISLAKVHLEPMALYSKRITSLKDLQDKAKIAVPSDPTNQARALLLLEKAGLLTLNKHDTTASVLNIRLNPKNLEVLEIDSPLLSRSLDDVDVAAITTNFALQAGLHPKESLAIESTDSAFFNVLVIREGDQNRTDLQKLKDALNSEKVRKFIEDKYHGAVIPAF